MYGGPGMRQALGYLVPGALKLFCQQDRELHSQGQCYYIPLLKARKTKLMNLKDLPKATLQVCRGSSIQSQVGLVPKPVPFPYVDAASTHAGQLIMCPWPTRMLADQWCNTWLLCLHISQMLERFCSNYSQSTRTRHLHVNNILRGVG